MTPKEPLGGVHLDTLNEILMPVIKEIKKNIFLCYVISERPTNLLTMYLYMHIIFPMRKKRKK